MGPGIGAIQTVAVGHECVQRYRLAGNGRGSSELFICIFSRRFFPGCVDDARSERSALPGGMRIVDWIYGLYLAAGTRANVESVDLRVCESGSRGVFGMADSARAGGPVHRDGKCHCGFVSDSGDERQGEGENCRGGIAGGGSGRVVAVTDEHAKESSQ